MNNQPALNRHAVPHFIFRGLCQGISHVSLTVKPWKKLIWFPAPLYQEPNQTFPPEIASKSPAEEIYERY